MKEISHKFGEILGQEIKVGEHVTWQAMPNVFQRIVGTLPAFLLSLAVIPTLYFTHTEYISKQGDNSLYLYFIPAVIVGALLFLYPVITWRRALNTLYVITNKRAFIVEAFKKTTVFSFYPEGIEYIEKKYGKNDYGDLIIARIHHTDDEDSKKVTDYGFYSINDLSNAELCLDKLINA